MRDIEIKLFVSEKFARDMNEETLAVVLGVKAARKAKALLAEEDERAPQGATAEVRLPNAVKPWTGPEQPPPDR